MPRPSRALQEATTNNRTFRRDTNPEAEQKRVYKHLQSNLAPRCSYSRIKPGQVCGRSTCRPCRLRKAREWFSGVLALMQAAQARSEPVYRLVAGHEDAQHLDEARDRYERFVRFLRSRHRGCRVFWALGVNDDGYLHRHLLIAGHVSRRELVDLLAELGLLDERRRGAKKWAVQEVTDAAALVHHVAYTAANGSAFAYVYAAHIKNLRVYSYKPRS